MLEIYRLSVDSEMRGRKIAHMLVDKVLQVRSLLLVGDDNSVMSPLLRISNHDDKMTCGQSSSSESLNTTGV